MRSKDVASSHLLQSAICTKIGQESHVSALSRRSGFNVQHDNMVKMTTLVHIIGGFLEHMVMSDTCMRHHWRTARRGWGGGRPPTLGKKGFIRIQN